MNQIIKRLAAKISELAHYSDIFIQLIPMEHDGLFLYERIKAKEKHISRSIEDLGSLHPSDQEKSIILLNGNLNHCFDIHNLMLNIKSKINRFSRIAIVLYNPYYGWLHSLLKKTGIKKKPLPTTYITRTDLQNILSLSGYEIVKTDCLGILPWRLFGIGIIVNQIIGNTPILKWLSHTYLIIVRPVIPDKVKRSISIIVPARNELGNIKNIVDRLEKLNLDNKAELIFVEGNSTDGTWSEILKVSNEYKGNYLIKTFQQDGKGKDNAVKLGFENAQGEILTILDADLTMPPELLPYFINAYENGNADFINGTRLVYPMEGQAMRPLNWLGNIFFAKTLSWTLDVPLGDSLCGTKLFHRNDYKRILNWWDDFNEHDPFGDFKLLFSASALGLGIKDIPIRYRARTYGETNINRFSHGYMLFKITIIGFIKLKLGLRHGK